MSFQNDVKKELCLRPFERRTAKAEIYGMLIGARSFSFEKILFKLILSHHTEEFNSFIEFRRHF